MNTLRTKTAVVREKRLQAITAFHGTADDLIGEHAGGGFVQRVRTFSQDVPNDVLRACRLAAGIRRASVVVHGAAGCAAGLWGNHAVTNLNERDSIMGGDGALREAIRQTVERHRPAIVFVVSTPLVAINNDDVEAVVEELKEELDIPVVPVYTDGFRSKTGATGYDVFSHALLKHLPLERAGANREGVNLLSVSEHVACVEEARRMLGGLGLAANVFPRGASVDDIRRLTGAAFSVSIDADDARYPGRLLEECYGVRFVCPPVPVGVANTVAWLTEVARVAGEEEKAVRWVDAEMRKLEGFLASRRPVARRVFLSLPAALAFGVHDALVELGYSVTGLKTGSLDASHLPQLEKLHLDDPHCLLHVGEGQVFEEDNILQRNPPDVYAGYRGDYSAAIRNGIPVVDLERLSVVGFAGVVALAQNVERAAGNDSFARRLARTATAPFTAGWLKRPAGWYIKQEVK